MSTVSNEFSDRLFGFVFGSEENREWTLSLYNAVNGTSYGDPDAISITTIRTILYLGMHNDVSFLIADEMSLYEQQSTYNPNMPLRQMQYAANVYDRYIKEHGLNKFSSAVLHLPAPRLVTFYNGPRDMDDEKYLHLTDSFPEGSKSDIEVTVRMINVNHGHSETILEACEPLKEYAWLIQEIRDKRKRISIEDAVNRAIDEVPRDFVIRPFLQAHRTEVYGMLLDEYNEAETMELFKEEGREEGREEGVAEGVERSNALYKCLKNDGRLEDYDKAVDDPDYYKQLLAEYKLG